MKRATTVVGALVAVIVALFLVRLFAGSSSDAPSQASSVDLGNAPAATDQMQTNASTGAPSADTSAPNPVPERNPALTGVTVTVSESTNIPTWSGPNDDTSSDGSAVFHQVGGLAPGSTVTIICTVYGRPSTVYAGSQSRLWDYTSEGYVPDSALHPVGGSPVAPACTGTLAHTQAGSGPPSQEAGPYPLYNNGTQVEVFDAPSTSANLQGQLEDGTYVHLVCWSPGSPVLGPTDIYGTSVGSTTNWNRINSPVTGWVSDAFVDSASATAVAPRC